MQPNRLPDLPAGKISRRAFVMSTLATGFALAVRPVSAQTITTDAAGVAAGEVQMPAGEITIPAYRAMPQAAGTFPVVLVVPEIFGVHEHIKDVCRRFAKLGYVAIAPELYVRHGDVSQMADIGAIILTVVRKVPDAQVMAGLDATVNWVESSDKGDVRKLGITGFCWGGRIVRMYAAHSPKVNAGVAWYGRLVGQTSERTPTHPVDVVSQLHAPVLGLYAGADSGIPQEKVEQMRAALQTGGSSSELHVYPDTPHGFHADYRSSYRKEAAQDGWQRL
jgi:carboxymethylenebutenolidase